MDNINELKLYFGDPYQINDQITLYQPSINEIIEYGEAEFYSVLYMFIGNSTYYRLFLWDNGIDWNKISDYELFCNLVSSLPLEKTKVFFGDIDFSKFSLYLKEDTEPEEEPDPDKKLSVIEKNKLGFRKFERTHTLYNEEQEIEISSDVYHDLVTVMRRMFEMTPKTEYTIGKTSKELIIEEERAKILRASKEDSQSTLLPLVSFCVNHPGFKYKTSELRDIKINEFMDSVKRLQVYESTHALINGSYSGFCDTSKIPKEQFNFMRPINS